MWASSLRKTCVSISTAFALANLFSAPASIAASQNASALYRCTGKDGKVIYSNTSVVTGHSCTAVATDYASPPNTRANLAAPNLTVAQAKKIAADTLIDPEATRFRDVVRKRNGAVCGNLNSKNIQGGYVGYARFVVTPWKEVYIRGQGDDYRARVEIRDHCSN